MHSVVSCRADVDDTVVSCDGTARFDAVGIAVVDGAAVAYALVAFGWGGFLSESLMPQIIGFGVAGATFAGIAARSVATARRLPTIRVQRAGVPATINSEHALKPQLRTLGWRPDDSFCRKAVPMIDDFAKEYLLGDLRYVREAMVLEARRAG